MPDGLIARSGRRRTGDAIAGFVDPTAATSGQAIGEQVRRLKATPGIPATFLHDVETAIAEAIRIGKRTEAKQPAGK